MLLDVATCAISYCKFHFCKQFLYLNLWTFTQCHVCKSRGTTNCLSSPWHFTFCGTYLWISSLSSSGPSVQLNSYSTNSTTWWLINWFKSIMFSYAFNLWSCDVSKQRDMYQPHGQHPTTFVLGPVEWIVSRCWYRWNLSRMLRNCRSITVSWSAFDCRLRSSVSLKIEATWAFNVPFSVLRSAIVAWQYSSDLVKLATGTTSWSSWPLAPQAGHLHHKLVEHLELL